jgi:hypothetical protein
VRIRVRTLKRLLITAGLVSGLLVIAVPVLADYTGPDRDISTWVWRRLACRYQAEYDEPGPGGYYSCTLRLYRPPDGSCPGNVGSFFNQTACVGWPGWLSCDDEDCDISRSSSVESCNEGSEGCRAVEQTVSQPPATIDGSIACDVPGSGSWCRGGGHLSLSGSEPLAGYEILALEGTHNGTNFACEGASCSISLLEGGNDFSFWALSSYGDTSNMGSANAGLDSQDPSLSGSVSGTSGDNGWYVSQVTVEASADDSTSGLASLDVQINGGGWSNYGGPFSLGDGSHDVELRAVDAAGNSRSESISIDIDTQPPFVDLAAIPSFCPGCGELLEITAIAQDGGSGLAAWSITVGGVTVADGSGDTGTTISWDGSGLGGGLHSLLLEGRDAAGNTAGVSIDFSLVLPTPRPRPPDDDDDDEDDEAPVPFNLPSATPSATGTTAAATRPATRTPTSTRTPLTVQFGGLPAAPAGPSSGDEAIPDLQSPPPTSPSGAASTVSPVLYGGAAAAVIAAATAIGLAEKRRRDEEEARRRAEMKAANARAEANDQARAAALAAAKAEAEFDLTMGQIVSQATGGSAPSAGWLAGAAAAAAEAARRLTRKEEKLEPKIPPARAPFVFYRSSKRESARVVPPALPWWQKAWEDAKSARRGVIDWIDQHQDVVSLAAGVVVAAAVIAVTAGAATPLAVAGLAALAAGGTVGLGTVNLNAYYNRPWNENLVRNAAYAVGGAAVVAGGWWLATGGLATIAGTVGGTVASLCGANPAVCARLEPALQAVDTGEQLLLSAQLAIQTATGDPRAQQTALELRLETMDGGLPGNTAIRQLRDIGEEAAEALARYGDEGAAIAAVVGERSDDVLGVLDEGIVYVRPADAQDFAEDLLSNIRALQGGDVRVYYSATSGAVYTSAPTTKALEAVDELTAIVKSGTTSGPDVDRLVEIIAAESTRGSGNRLVLGQYGANGVYIHEALDDGGQFYDTGGVVWERLKALGDRGFDPWRVNEAALRSRLESGARVDFVAEDIATVLNSNDPLVFDSPRADEIRWLMENASDYGYRLEGNSWLRTE